MLSRGLPVNPGEQPTSPEQGAVLPNPKRTRSRGKRGCPTGSEQTLDVEYLPPRETGGAHGGVCEGGRSAAPRRTYTGTQSETADTDKGTLKVLIDSSPTRRAN